MASITKQPNGRKTIQFHGSDGERRSIRLGKVSLRIAESVKVHVERLASAALSGHVAEDETARWLANLDSVMANKLASVGLVPKRESATLAAFIDDYFAKRSDVTGSTLTAWGHTRRNLIQFFGPNKPLREITLGDADDWRLSLLDQGLAVNTTVRRRCGFAKQYFHAAVRAKLITSNPFADLKSVVQGNASRFYYVTCEEIEKVLGACPDAQWRLIVALSRYGGLRCPSEHLSMKWTDVNWEHERVNVTSPKTKRHQGGESRTIPLFPELKPYLEECFELAEPGSEYVITRYRDSNTNLRTQMLKIIRRAGLQPWPKLFQNLRSTRQTELEETYPTHVVCAWLGNSRAVAAKHYLQVTDAHFEKAVQNPVQQAHATPRKPKLPRKKKPLLCRGVRLIAT